MKIEIGSGGQVRLLNNDGSGLVKTARTHRPETAAGHAWVRAQRYRDQARTVSDPVARENYLQLAKAELAKAGL